MLIELENITFLPIEEMTNRLTRLCSRYYVQYLYLKEDKAEYT